MTHTLVATVRMWTRRLLFVRLQYFTVIGLVVAVALSIALNNERFLYVGVLVIAGWYGIQCVTRDPNSSFPLIFLTSNLIPIATVAVIAVVLLAFTGELQLDREAWRGTAVWSLQAGLISTGAALLTSMGIYRSIGTANWSLKAVIPFLNQVTAPLEIAQKSFKLLGGVVNLMLAFFS